MKTGYMGNVGYTKGVGVYEDAVRGEDLGQAQLFQDFPPFVHVH